MYNKSSAYGYYGGVKNGNQYTPGQPPTQQQKSNYELNEETRKLLENAANQMTFVQQNASNIVLRRTTAQHGNNVETFVLSTSGKPEDVIVYTSYKDEVVLTDLGGDGIEDGIDTVVDAGFF